MPALEPANTKSFNYQKMHYALIRRLEHLIRSIIRTSYVSSFPNRPIAFISSLSYK